MYHIHTTPGLVIDSRNYGEGGKILSIFTENHGLVYAIAQGIRLEKSKLRYYAQNYSFAQFSLVRGKEYWRLTSVLPISKTDKEENVTKNTHESNFKQILIARISFLLKRLLQGEERHMELFRIIFAAIEFLDKNMTLNEEQEKTLESIIIYKIMHALGYIGLNQDLRNILDSEEITVELLDRNMNNRKSITQHVNKALAESHL